MNINKLINGMGNNYNRLIFISHKYADNPIQNRKDVDRICKYWVRRGFIPISPLHLFSYMDGDEDRETILQICHMLILLCPQIAVYHRSAGCDDERRFAERHRKKIYYFFKYKKKSEKIYNSELKYLMEHPEDIIV